METPSASASCTQNFGTASLSTASASVAPAAVFWRDPTLNGSDISCSRGFPTRESTCARSTPIVSAIARSSSTRWSSSRTHTQSRAARARSISARFTIAVASSTEPLRTAASNMSRIWIDGNGSPSL